jgi:chromate transporter
VKILVIFAEFCKIGLFSVGGGLATLPFLFELAKKYEWLSPEKIGDFLAIAQSSPGGIGINMVAQAGFHWAGISGACIVALALAAPSIVIIIIIARMLKEFKENRIVTAVFSGLRPASAGLLAAAGFNVWKLSLYNASAGIWYESLRLRETVLFAAFFLGVYKLKGHPIIYVAIAAVLGVVLKL